jgi:predicted flap endonuclease-1-like 5' DNA nuclease
MTFNIDPQLAAVVIAALLLGLFLGLALRSPLKRKAAVLAERVAGLERERAGLQAERERLTAEVKAREAQIRPLADEIDKLRRDFARASAGQTPKPASEIDLGDLRLLKGVGPKFADRLKAAGINSLDQIAGWTAADVQVMDGQMGDFAGRIASDQLVEQARLLHEGRLTEYETRFGKIGPA